MKKFLVLFLVLFACTAYAQGIPSPSTPRLMADDAGNYVSQSYPLPVSVIGADVAAIDTIASSSEAIEADVAAIEAELLSVGTAVDIIASSSEAIDADVAAIEAELLSVGTAVDIIASSSEAIEAELLSVGTAVDTIASSSEAIDNNTKQCSQFKVQVVALTANTSRLLVSGLNGNRKFVEIKSHLPNQQFWVSFTDTAVVNLCRPCTEYFYAEVPSNVDVAIIASSAMTLSVVEGGL